MRLTFCIPAVYSSWRGATRDGQGAKRGVDLALFLRGLLFRHRSARATTRARSDPDDSPGLRLARLSDPKQGPCRQQGQSGGVGLEWTHRFRCCGDNPPECGSDRHWRLRRGTASDQDAAAQGRPLYWFGAGDGGARSSHRSRARARPRRTHLSLIASSVHRCAALCQPQRRFRAGLLRRWHNREPDHGPVPHSGLVCDRAAHCVHLQREAD